MISQDNLESLLKRDRLVVIACLAVATLIAAFYILNGAGMGMTALQMTIPMQHMGAAEPSESLQGGEPG